MGDVNLPLMSTKIHPINVHENSPKHCPREFAFSVHKNSPKQCPHKFTQTMSTKIHPNNVHENSPNNVHENSPLKSVHKNSPFWKKGVHENSVSTRVCHPISTPTQNYLNSPFANSNYSFIYSSLTRVTRADVCVR